MHVYIHETHEEVELKFYCHTCWVQVSNSQEWILGPQVNKINVTPYHQDTWLQNYYQIETFFRDGKKGKKLKSKHKPYQSESQINCFDTKKYSYFKFWIAICHLECLMYNFWIVFLDFRVSFRFTRIKLLFLDSYEYKILDMKFRLSPDTNGYERTKGKVQATPGIPKSTIWHMY